MIPGSSFDGEEQDEAAQLYWTVQVLYALDFLDIRIVSFSIKFLEFVLAMGVYCGCGSGCYRHARQRKYAIAIKGMDKPAQDNPSHKPSPISAKINPMRVMKASTAGHE
jgi:hypothetical protein